MSESQSETLQLIVDLSINLLGVSLTLIALIPVLVELVRGRAPDFMSKFEEENALDRTLLALSVTVLLFSSAIGCGIGGRFCTWVGFLWIALITFLMGLLVIIFVSMYVAFTTRRVM